MGSTGLQRRGVAPPSMVSGLMGSMSEVGVEEGDYSEEAVIRNAASNAYGGGADTVSTTYPTCHWPRLVLMVCRVDLQTLSTVQWFFVAMTLFPDVQKKAQAELMEVIGPSRLPEYGDEESLPYIRALAKECLRWRSVVPLGLPHRATEDGEYRGYRIPKGSMVIANLW